MIRKVLLQGFKIVISVFLIGFILHRIGIKKIMDHLQTAEIHWLVGALVLFTASHFLGSFQWWMLLRSEGIQMPWKKALSFYFVSTFFNNFLIGNLGGDLFRIVDVRRYSKKGTGAVSTVFLDRFIGFLVLSGMAVITVPYLLIRLGISLQLMGPFLLLILLWIFMILFFFNRRFAKPFAWIIQRLIPSGISAKAREVYQKIHDFGRRKNLILRVISVSLLVQVARVLTHYLLSRSFGVDISPLYFFFIVPIVVVVISLPISVGGIGLREQTGIILFGVVGMTQVQAFSVEFMAYLATIVSSLPGGIVFMLRRRMNGPREKKGTTESGIGVRK